MKIFIFANTDWYLYNFRLPLGQALKEKGYQVVFISPPGEYTTRLQEAGIDWKEFCFSRRGMNPLKEGITVIRLAFLYLKEKPDIVHNFTIKCILYSSLAAKLSGVSLVINAVTGLGHAFSEKSRKLVKLIVKYLYRIALRRTHTIFQNSDDQGYFLQENLVSPKNLTLIRSSGVDVGHFSPKEEPEEIPLVILPARMLWEKGVGEFVESAKLLKAKGVRARFVLVGDTDIGNPSSISREQLEDWNEEGVIEWWGWKEDMVDIYNQAHLVCLPSYREGLPRTLIEAAACECPIVSTDVPGCREIVQNRKNGLLVRPRDPIALSKALEKLISNPSLRRVMGKRGREMVANQFSQNKVVKETIKVYQEIM